MKPLRSYSLPQNLREVLATHLVAEFGHIYPEWDVAAAVQELAEDKGHGLPLHLAFVEGDEVLGSTSIIADDEVAGWDEEGWWLANVFVLPQFRGSGIGKELIKHAVDIAHQSGATELHLVTDTVENWYLNQGWKTVGIGDVHGHAMTVMHLEIVGRSRI